ncbi:HD domain-containing protein [Amycolatopsis endophytica]|uniref:Gamma-butyrobetaine dioxygenase n=1 Tax=Amycolatopsis endophytica TaxID=860233 RepID=A0A853BAD9_9PSEU|nr:HD domain-containing protein [Amycolatopsis endophytica]NYI91376.1 gamma-butyrobetaine dioxygenase [Amycolatopsis endophytica]
MFTVEKTVEVLRALEGDYDGDEAVDQLAHALQTAELARAAGADDDVVAAALLHDIGRAPGVVEHYRGQPHEIAGADFCLRHVGERASYLVGQHVPAKRYLVVIDEAYAASLSPASQRSLIRQGGPMSAEEVTAFESHPWAAEAARLRRWDDAAKVPGARVHELAFYADVLRRVWLPAA